METLKKCRVCGKELPLTEFYKFIGSAGQVRYKNKCKDCYNRMKRYGGMEVPDGMRKCPVCGVVLPLSEYGKRRNGYMDKICLGCKREKKKSYEKAKRHVSAEKRHRSKQTEQVQEQEEQFELSNPRFYGFRIEERNGRYAVCVRLIYIGEPDAWRWETIEDLPTHKSAIRYMMKCVHLKSSTLKVMAEEYRVKNEK